MNVGVGRWYGLCRLSIAATLVALLATMPAYPQSPGDANCDGIVNGEDARDVCFALFNDPSPACSTADVNADGQLDSADLVALMQILRVPPTPIPQGPNITLFAVTGANGAPIDPIGRIGGAPVFFRNSGFGFKLAVEGRTGNGGVAVGTTTFDSQSNDPSHRPDVQIECSNALGDGSPTVCDGGVPAVSPPDFGAGQAIANALNDLGCNFTETTSKDAACTQDQFGTANFLGAGTQVQFCLQVPRMLAFPLGDTVLTARLRDLLGNLGPTQQLILRVGSGPVPPTFTPAPTFTPFVPQPTRTPSLTYTPRPPPTPTPTRTVSPTATTRTDPPTATRTPTSSAAVTPPSPTRTATRTPSWSPTPSPTVPGPPGPRVSFFGLTQSDDTLIDPSGTTPQGVPIFTRPTGTAFNLVVEGAPGTNHVMLGNLSYAADLLSLPDLQMEASRDLGNGSAAVCDSGGTNAGGVPGVDPPNLQPTSGIIAVVNDFGCRFVNGSGQPIARTSSDACTPNPSSASGFGFVNTKSTAQYCASITKVLEFPQGDTLLTARLQDTNATPGPTAQIVVRVGAPPATPTATSSATATTAITRTATAKLAPTATPSRLVTGVPSPTSPPPRPTATTTATGIPRPTASPTPSGNQVGPAITFFGLARSDDVLLAPDGTTPGGLPLYVRANAAAFQIVVEGRPGSNGRPVGRSAYQSDLSSLPDLQVEVSQAIGNGSPDVCDSMGPTAGGVPAINPPRFDATPEVIAAVNDLACRFLDGSGHPQGRGPSEGCVLLDSGDEGFVNRASTVQFCGLIEKALVFPPGDTTVTVRLLDTSGNPGAPAQLVVRVGA